MGHDTDGIGFTSLPWQHFEDPREAIRDVAEPWQLVEDVAESLPVDHPDPGLVNEAQRLTSADITADPNPVQLVGGIGAGIDLRELQHGDNLAADRVLSEHSEEEVALAAAIVHYASDRAGDVGGIYADQFGEMPAPPDWDDSDRFKDGRDIRREVRETSKELAEDEGVEYTEAAEAVESETAEMLEDSDPGEIDVEAVADSLAPDSGGPNRSLIALVAGVIGLLIIILNQ